MSNRDSSIYNNEQSLRDIHPKYIKLFEVSSMILKYFVNTVQSHIVSLQLI